MYFWKAILVLSITTLAFADEFSDLKKKQIDVVSKDPFGNNKAFCQSITESGIKLTEKWSFFKTSPSKFIRFATATTSNMGTYSVTDDFLILNETKTMIGSKELPSEKSWKYKYKIKPGGFQYIHSYQHEGNEKKVLYECIWAGSSLK